MWYCPVQYHDTALCGQLELVGYKSINAPQAGLYGVNALVCMLGVH